MSEQKKRQKNCIESTIMQYGKCMVSIDVEREEERERSEHTHKKVARWKQADWKTELTTFEVYP